jgi:hypothetical protein
VEERVPAGRGHVLVVAPVAPGAESAQFVLDAARVHAVVEEIARHGAAELLPLRVTVDQQVLTAEVLNRDLFLDPGGVRTYGDGPEHADLGSARRQFDAPQGTIRTQV